MPRSGRTVMEVEVCWQDVAERARALTAHRKGSGAQQEFRRTSVRLAVLPGIVQGRRRM